MPQVIGIVGGGQLGRMLTQAASNLGYRVKVVDPNQSSPAKQVGAGQIIAGYKDSEALFELADESDFITIEIEHIDAKALSKIGSQKPVNPSGSTIRMIQDKYRQKIFLRDNGFPTADFIEINDQKEAEQIFDKWNGQMILKSKTEAFDGRGNVLISKKEDINDSIKKFTDNGIYAEKIVNFKKELAVMAAKDHTGKITVYPVVETVHKRNICTEVYAPADIDKKTSDEAEAIVKDLVSKLEGSGIYGIELFLDERDNLLINEIAPRVHNSGHYTMDMFDTSQFTQHILAITNNELKKPKQKAKYCCMVNILGERDGPVRLKGVEEAGSIPGVSVYTYGKSPTKIDRKMGHINALGDTMEEAKEKAIRARKLIDI